MLIYDETKSLSQDIYNIKTRKIISYPNLIASTSNVIWVGGNMAAGNQTASKDLDFGGLVVTLQRLPKDTQWWEGYS